MLPEIINQTISITSPDINNDTTASIQRLGIIVNNVTLTSLPNIVIASLAEDIPAVSAMVIPSGISTITNVTVPSGSAIIDAISIPTYSMPIIENVTVVIPPIIINDANTNILMTPPVDSWVSGQQVIISARDSGATGLRALEMNFTASDNTSRSSSDEWLVLDVRASIPDIFPDISENTLFLNVKYPNEEGRGGIDWSDPQSHSGNPNIILGVPKPDNSYTDDITDEGCAVYRQLLIYVNSTNTWNPTNSTIASNESSSDTLCILVLSFEHFSTYGVSTGSSGSSSSGSSSSGSSSSGSSSSGSSSSGSSSSGSSSSSSSGSSGVDGRVRVTTDTSESEIPSWVLDVALSWASGESQDRSFGAVLNYLAGSGTIPHTDKYGMPEWVKNPVLWWGDNLVTDKEFIDMISYLVSNDILE